VEKIQPRMNELTCSDNREDTTVGHAIQTIDTGNTVRLILQNPNGFNIQENLDDFDMFLKYIADLGSGMVGIAETNINWNQPSHLRLAHTIKKRHFSASALIPSNHPPSFLSPVQAGGALSILMDRWVS